MRKFGKYEKMRKSAILQTYVTSILCLALCVTMFFGTSMAWFSDTAESTQNQMYVGTLDVTLNHMTFTNKELKKVDGVVVSTNVAETENYKVIDSNIKWEPGYTAVEKFELIENGDLAFSYQMGIECEFAESTVDNVTTTVTEKEAIAKAITVWNYVGTKAQATETLPETFDKMTAEDADSDGNADWEAIGTLYDVITNHTSVFSGTMEKAAVTKTKTENDKTVADPAKAYHMIALHMEEAFADSSVQGKTLNDITIKLVATQKSSEQDAFGSDYDKEITLVNTAEELAEQLVAGSNVLLNDNVTIDANTVMNGGTLDGNGKTLTAEIDTGYDCAITTTGGRIQNLTITGNKDSTRATGAGSTGDYQLSSNLYIDNVTIDKVQYAINGSGTGKESVYVTNSTIYGWCSFANIALFSFDNCTLGIGNSYDGYMVVYGDTTFNDCNFVTFDMCADDSVVEGSVITFNNCTNDGQKVTVDNFKTLFMYPGDDVDFNKLQKCTIIIDGATLQW